MDILHRITRRLALEADQFRYKGEKFKAGGADNTGKRSLYGKDEGPAGEFTPNTANVWGKGAKASTSKPRAKSTEPKAVTGYVIKYTPEDRVERRELVPANDKRAQEYLALLQELYAATKTDFTGKMDEDATWPIALDDEAFKQHTMETDDLLGEPRISPE